MRTPRLVIFDFDGTLFRTQESISHCISLTFTALSQPSPTTEAIRSVIATGASLEETFRMLGAGHTFATLSENPTNSADSVGESKPAVNISLWIDTYRSFYTTEGLPLITPFPHAHSLMALLRNADIPMVVISNKGVKAVEAVLKNTEMDQMVDIVLGDIAGVPRKPDPTSYFQFVAPKFASPPNKLDPKDVMVVGDTVADIQFAKNIGAVSCWVRYGYGDREGCEALAPDMAVDSLQELEQVIRMAIV